MLHRDEWLAFGPMGQLDGAQKSLTLVIKAPVAQVTLVGPAFGRERRARYA